MRRGVVVAGLGLYAALVVAVVLGPQVFAKRTTAAPTVCTGTLAHATTNDITVPDGAICRVKGSTVNGTITVHGGAYFEATDTTIYGNVYANGALTVFLHDGTSVSGTVRIDGTDQLFLYKTTVDGAVNVSHAGAPGFGHVQICQSAAGSIEVRSSGPDVLVGDPKGGCPGNVVKSGVVVAGNQTLSELQVSGNTIRGSLSVTDNTGTSPKNVMDNTVHGDVDLSRNAEPFNSSDNGPDPQQQQPAS